MILFVREVLVLMGDIGNISSGCSMLRVWVPCLQVLRLNQNCSVNISSYLDTSIQICICSQ